MVNFKTNPDAVEPEGVDYSQKDPGFLIGSWDS